MNIYLNILSIIFVQALAVQSLEAVCSYTEKYTDSERYYDTESVPVLKIGFFGNQYYDWEQQIVSKTRTVYKTRWKYKCCSGYISENSNCVPFCAGGCINAKCVAPGKCKCFEGYRTDGNNHCTIPVCVDGCMNGSCIAPNKCQCHQGYRLSSNLSKCEPICSQNCENGFCHLPEICACNKGYQKGLVTDYQCKPVCSGGCLNGICVEPEECQCLEGYRMTSDSDETCNPICEPECLNADCVKPNSCTCWKDYVQINKTSCDTYCSIHMHCINGYCSSPNSCKCNEGYEPQSTGSDVCIAVCENCDFGYCQAPGMCVCYPGYRMDEISSLCYPTTTMSSTESFDTTEMTTTTETETQTETVKTTVTAETSSEKSISSHKMFDSYYDEYEIDSSFSTSTEDEVTTLAITNSDTILFCDCWSLASNVSTSDCIPGCNISSHETPCINIKQCQMDNNQKDLACNGKTYICKTTMGTTSARTQVWSIWLIFGILFLAVALIGTVFMVRHFRQQRNAVRSRGDEISPAYIVQYMSNENTSEQPETHPSN